LFLVFFLFHLLFSGKVPKSTIVQAIDPVIMQLIERLSDGNGRIRAEGRLGLDFLAASPVVGPGIVANQLTKPLASKQKTAWRPLASRLEVLASLVANYGLNNNAGLHLDSMLNFAKNNQAYTHSHNEVRDAAKRLVVAIHKEVGVEPLQPTLALLRDKQRDDYYAAFGEGGNAPAAAAPAAKGKASGGHSTNDQHSPNSRRTNMAHQHATHNPGGKVPTSQTRVENQSHGYGNNNGKGGDAGGGAGGKNKKQPQKSPIKEEQQDENEEKQDFTACMFCGISDRKWNENDLDLHYWKDCPLLISCPSCAQIVEIAGLPEHLLDECEQKDDYVPCDITGKPCQFSGSLI
jgi:centrosomal protein CEP104